MSASQSNLSAYYSLPAYTAEPRRGHEQRLLVHDPPNVPLSIPSPPRQWQDQFVKHSKSGGVTLKVYNQRSDVPFPTYHGGANNSIRGCVDLAKTENVTCIDLKECLEGRLLLHEVAAGGASTTELCSQRITLWTREHSLTDTGARQACQISLPFTLNLPTTFSDEYGTYPLPPSFESNLPGLPGFHATITYSLSVVANKSKSSLFSLGNPTLSTPLIYLPRSRPPTPSPPALHPATFTPRLDSRSDWQAFTTMIKIKRPFKGASQDLEDIESKLYLHTTRIFPITQSIPFYLSLLSSSSSLGVFMPFGPQTQGSVGSSVFGVGGYQCTRMRLTRQVIVDAKNPNLRAQTATIMWDMTTIGEGRFKLFNHGSDWITFYGEIPISSEVKVSGFKAAGLLVRDFLSLTMVPSDPAKSPFKEFHQTIPIRLTTDLWA
ncbi:hypothetical protein BDM02DRAFT_3099426 [Thelephora ganbajun]|uniref:Uncharacterized protein n=1 Tax=Thelephora ganbajun TaxID=370292 RepID=A0ACB6ZAX3_THEGA|nr:hypothetical protein BDM02DRAFT_3099426 [Thelephora ganbajun]